MGLIQAFTGGLTGTFADQWRDIVTAAPFGEQVVVSPGVLKQTNNGRGSNYRGSQGVISNGSKIFVPENTAAYILSQAGIEDIITDPGGYEYTSGQATVFANDGIKKSIVDQFTDRFSYGGQTSNEKYVAFVNLREIRGIKFGTRGPVVYHDHYYETDLEITSFGSFTVQVTDVLSFIRNFLPANVRSYSFSTPEARQQVLAEFLQSFTVALNSLSTSFRISQLPSQSEAIAQTLTSSATGVGTWDERYGFKLINIGIENIELTADSKSLINQFSSNRMNVRAYEGSDQQTSNVASQQSIAQGIEAHGLGDGGGMVFGMNMANSMDSSNAQQGTKTSLDDQIEAVKKLKELLDAGILSQEEFDAKKREALGLSAT